MSYVVEVDQSVRIEDAGDTFLAFANDISWVVRVPFRTKRAGFQLLVEQGKSKKQAKPLLFAACVFLLVKDHLHQIERIVVDNEYDGHAADVKAALLRHIWRHHGSTSNHQVDVTSIGKQSPAHKSALAVKRGQGRKADKTVTVREVIGVLRRK